MFEIIETQQIFNLTCYKVRTTRSVDWYYFKGREIKDIRHFKGLKYCKQFNQALFQRAQKIYYGRA